MSGDIRETLETQFDELNQLYLQNLHAVRDLQRVLISDILPGLADEHGWNKDQINYAKEWLVDTESVFRMLKRHRFTTSIAMETLQSTLPWRLSTLPPWSPRLPSPYLRCLPIDVRDPLGRPIIVIQLSGLWNTNEDLKASLFHNIELMRLHLVRLNEREPSACPVLQYVALLDIRGLAFNSVISVQLLGWFVHDVIPKFPGLLASALVLNYSWAQAGLWNLAKRLLPASALQKVFFPTNDQLKAFLTSTALPKDWDGDLPYFADIENALQDYAVPSPLYSPPSPIIDAEPPRDASAVAAPPTSVLSSTSLLNPFFGYPVAYTDTDLSSSTPNLRHGRRRKRDLFYTLLRLWWTRWKTHIKVFLFILLLILTSWQRRRIFNLLRVRTRKSSKLIAL